MPIRNATGWVRRHPVSLAMGVGAVALHVGAVGLFAVHNPYTETIFPPCPLLQLTGWQCPGCGGTRAMYSLLHGDVLGSLAMNPLVVAGYIAVGLCLVGISVDRRRHWRPAQVLYWAAAAIAVGVTLYSGLLRNLIA